MTTLRYFAIVPADGRRWQELLIVRENGRQVSSAPTGVIYPTQALAKAAITKKNVA